MDHLKELLQSAMSSYTGEALNGYSYLTRDPDQNIFAVIFVGQLEDQRIVDAGLVVRLENDIVVIEHDANDKPLVDALLEVGISRTQICLAYAGEVLKGTAAA